MLPVHDFLVGVLRRLGAERGVADQHLVHDDAQAPPVAGGRVSGLKEYFRRDVVCKKFTQDLWGCLGSFVFRTFSL